MRDLFAGMNMTTKLSVLYSTAAFGMLLVISLIVDAALERYVERENVELVAAIIPLLTDEIEKNGLPPTSSVPGRRGYYVRVFDNRGVVVFSSDGAERLNLPAPHTREFQTGDIVPQGDSYVFAGSAAMRGSPDRTVQVAIDATDDVRLLKNYRNALIVALVGGFVVSGLIGHIVARSGLVALKSIASATEQVTVSGLRQGLAVKDWPGELTQLVLAINRMLGRIEEAFQRLSRVSYDLAHELRTPINNLIGEAGVVLAKDREAGEYRAVIGSALEEYERLSRTLDALLFFARAENPQNRIQRDLLRGEEELRKVVAFYESLAFESGIALDVRGAAPVYANQVLFSRAVSNLLSNAIKHTPAGGRIRLEMRQEAAGASVVVQDEGPGIVASELPHVFDRFYRTEVSRSLQIPGSGLGLSIVKAIMDWHSGQVGITSDAGKGACVTLTFPAAAAGKPA